MTRSRFGLRGTLRAAGTLFLHSLRAARASSSVEPEESRPIAHGSGQMRAQSISFQMSDNPRCTAGCKFCISRTTPGTTDVDPRTRKTFNMDRLRVGLGYAKQLGASHAILTGRADPTQEDDDYLIDVIRTAREYVPLVDMHTNGYLMLPGMPKENLLKKLVDAGLTMITLSIAHHEPDTNRALMLQKHSPIGLIKQARELGLLVRASLVINREGIANVDDIMDYIRVLGDMGVQMVVIREVWRPESYQVSNQEVVQWNADNWIDIGPLQEAFELIAEIPDNPDGLSLGNPLPWGTPVFLVGGIFKDPSHGVNVTFARCEEANGGTVMKSIVHKPDGHGYRNWDHNGDVLY